MADRPPADRVDNLTSRTLSGMQWTYIATIASALMQVAFTAIMGRLLDPVAFGLVAMANVALRFGTYFARMGVSHALVQKAELRREELRAGFTSNAGLGILFAALFWAGAPLATLIFDEQNVVPVLRWMSLTLAIAGLYGTSQALLRRQLRFKALAARDVISYLVGYLGVGVGMAVAGYGVYSLVGAALTQGALAAVLSYTAARHPITPTFRWNPYRALYGFGARVSVISFMEFLASNADTFAVGRFAGSALLGQYNRAYLLVNLPLQQITTSLTKVLFPSLSRVQDDFSRLRNAYLSVSGALATLLLPACAGLAIAAPELVALLLGPQWGPAQRILPILAFAAAAHMLSHIAGILCEAAAKLNAKMMLQGLYLAALIGFFALAVGRGLEAYALAVLAGETVRHLGYLLLLRRAFALRTSSILRRYAAALFAAALVAGAIGSTRLALIAFSTPTLPLVIAEIVVGTLALIFAFRSPPLKTIRTDIFARLENSGAFRSKSRLVHAGRRIMAGEHRTPH